MNNKIYKLLGVTENDFKIWCKENKREAYKLANKREFFAKVIDKQLVRDPETKRLVKSRGN